jgi:hypothetical protein
MRSWEAVMPNPNECSLFDGAARAWIEQESSIHVKVVEPSGDPVELTWREARQLGELLIRLADEGEGLD